MKMMFAVVALVTAPALFAVAETIDMNVTIMPSPRPGTTIWTGEGLSPPNDSMQKLLDESQLELCWGAYGPNTGRTPSPRCDRLLRDYYARQKK